MTTPLSAVTGISPQACLLFGKLGIFTTTDLLFHLPRGYEDRSRITPLAEVRPFEHVLVEGVVQSVDHAAGRRPSLAVQITDGHGRLTLRFYQVYAALKEKFAMGRSVRAFGEVRVGARGLEMYHPEIQPVTPGAPLPPERLTAVYPSTEGLGQERIRRAVATVLQHFPVDLIELLPPNTGKQYDLKTALIYVHTPPSHADTQALREGRHAAQQRLIFEELVAHQLTMLTRRDFIRQVQAPVFKPQGTRTAQFLASLPFTPTGAQTRVVQEITQDLQKPVPMLRLLQGDVGAGKTLVAALSALVALESGWQVALMAPTELLAEQHAINFKRWFEPLGLKVGWLAGKQKGKTRRQTEEAIAAGIIHMVVGTHALFQDAVKFARLGLVIIDEQHRFGVDQRLALREKGADGMTPHQLLMTATPIPRTLAMSVYGDLDTSVIDELPPNRTPIQTLMLPFSRRQSVINRIAANCQSGKQAYWVCTLVEESETLDAKAAEETFAELSLAMPQVKMGLVHGRLRSEDKQQVMQSFKNNEIQLLIATTVIEVGVDVPNASLMVIENAERLGLSQLHQLRGRVGRGSAASFCVLMHKTPLSLNGSERLMALTESTDGFVIAEKDLELRGPGEMLGTRQTGQMGFKLANLQRDGFLLDAANRLAERMLVEYTVQAEQLVRRWLPNAPRYAHV